MNIDEQISLIRTVGSEGKGRLSFFEGTHDVPFEIKRVYYIYGVPEGIERGGHAHRKLSQLLVCTYGSIEILLDDGFEHRTVLLDDPSKGLLVEGFIWREMRWLKEGSVLMVAASEYYDEADYIRDRAVFDREAAARSRSRRGGGGCLVDMRRVTTGSGVVVEGGADVPFDLKRVYYTYGVPEGTMRGGHAHRGLEQLLVCTSGAIEILLDDGAECGSVLLDDPAKGLLVGPMVWHDMRWAEEGSVLSVLASGYYDEADYIRNYGDFEREVALRAKEIQADGR